jgi:D-glycero-alpha-D-manno-heptose-7-phosphate kinase
MQPVTWTAPARVDLAGGTLDLWPLGVLHEGSCTVNLAIDRRSTARVASIARGFEVVSADRGSELRFASAKEARGEPSARLAAEVALAFDSSERVRIETLSAVPFGSGLGGSSALLVAIVAALAEFTGRELSREQLVAMCRDIETRVLNGPAGTQDYEGACGGGLQILRHGPFGRDVERPRLDPGLLDASLLLFDTAESHSSGLNNWEIYKARIDGDTAVRKALDGIRDAAREMADAALAADLPRMGAALLTEWTARRGLSPRISTPTIEAAVEAALGAGAWGAKVCGAGGGGVVAILAPASEVAAVARALGALPQGRIFPAHVELGGLRRNF